MKNTLIKSAVLGLLVSGCMKQMSESATDEQAGLNGSFEHFKNGLPSNWLVYTKNTAGEGDFTITPNKTDFVDGKQSLEFSVNTCSDKGGRFSPGIAQEVVAAEGEEYLVSFWIKNKTTDFMIKIKGVNAFNGSEGPVLRSSETINEWRKFEYTYKIPVSMEKLRFEVSVIKPGTLLIDQVTIKKTEKT